jgi:GNAT superfamily N-acetyltransferase/uncharacterized damage-inducible protein DinB
MVIDPTEQRSPTVAIQQDNPSLGPLQLIESYAAGPDLLLAAVVGMTREDFLARPISGKWSTLEVVCHIADTEQFFADRMKRTLAMNRPLLVSADGWLYPKAVRYHDRDPEEELALITVTRRQVAGILKVVPDEAWTRPAIHTEMGLVTLRQLLLHAIGHLKHHVAFIEQKRQALAAALSTISLPATSSAPHEVARQGDCLISTDPRLLDVPLIYDFLANRSYWAMGRPLEVVRRSLENSLCFGLYEQGRQIGFTRVVTDRAMFAWLCDVFVLEAYRDRGLSKWLLGCVMAHPVLKALRRILLGIRDAHTLYAKFGFTPLDDSSRFMEVFRHDAYQLEQL